MAISTLSALPAPDAGFLGHLAKALGAPQGLKWHDATVHRRDDGRPHLVVAGTVEARAEALGVHALHVSLSHDAGIASAVVVAEG